MEEPREVVERIHRLVLDGDVEGQADLFAPDGVLEWPFAPAGVPTRLEGRQAIREVLAPIGRRLREAAVTRPTGMRSVVHQTLDPEVVVVEVELEGEVVATGDT